MKTKSFPLAVVLSVTTGRLLCQMGDVYEILNHVTGDSLFTHVLPRAGKFAKPLILAKHPELAEAEPLLPGLDGMLKLAKTPMEAVGKWLAALELPASLDIESHADAWLSMDPIAELEGMVGKDKVIAIEH